MVGEGLAPPTFIIVIRSFSGRPGGRPLQEILLFFVGAIHESPVFICGLRLFLRGVEGLASNDNNKTKNQPVILSEGRRVRPPTEVELLRVERKRTSKSASR